MKYLLSALFIFFILGCNIIPEQEILNVYWCSGQSNATVVWYESIKEEILKEDPTAIVIHTKHGGHSIVEWINGGIPQSDYIEDIEIIKDTIVGIDYDFKGFFWFQGESDRQDFQYPTYEENFYDLINLLGSDLNDNDFNILLTIVDWESGNILGIENVREIQNNIIENNNQIVGIDSRGYPRRDGVHLTIESYEKIGKESVIIFNKNLHMFPLD